MRALLLALLIALTPTLGLAQNIGPGGGGLVNRPTSVPFGQGIAASYLGEVATRAAIPTNFAAGGTFNQTMARSTHYARQTITSLLIVVPNFYVSSSSGEVATGGPATVTESIEYPLGVFTQVKFAGQASGTIPSGGMLTSDPVIVKIPNGAKFWVRVFFVNSTGGVVYRTFNQAQTEAIAIGDALTFGLNTLTDQTMGGTVGATTTSLFAFPVAIVANTTQASVCLIGDNRMAGVADAGNDDSLDGGPVARRIGQGYGYINEGVSGNTTANFVVQPHTNQVALAQYCSVGVDELGINDIVTNAATAAAVATNRTAIAALVPGLQMYGTTLEPVTTSTDSWATTTNQTVAATNSVRTAFNALVLGGITGELNFVDLSAMVDPLATGKLPVTGSAFGCTTDGINENAVSAQLSNNGNACGAFLNPFRNIDFTRR